ncbi:hypothetical protein [Parahaliea mediterranea]|uniref:hypothetical protein n=1 Tax=Parahaliea mediterranea TaxID=651086 RepID=UPI000E2FE8A9|nr:hypothetical protein [Parahaliea mediterranea]
MISFLQHRSPRFGYDGWALLIPGAAKPLEWTVCTTRAECRRLRRDRGNLFERGAQIVKVKVSVEVVDG